MTEHDIAATTKIRTVFEASRQQVDADPRLTTAAKAETIKAMRAAANKQLKALHDEYTAGVKAERVALERALLAPPRLRLDATASEKIARDASYRDGCDRAARTDPTRPAELLDVVRRAHRSGDDIQGRAALVVAFERNDIEAMNEYASANPADLVSIERLYGIVYSQASLPATMAAALPYTDV